MNTSLKHTFSERKFDRYSMLIANFFARVKQQYFIQKCHNLPTCKTSSDSLEFLSICEPFARWQKSVLLTRQVSTFNKNQPLVWKKVQHSPSDPLNFWHAVSYLAMDIQTNPVVLKLWHRHPCYLATHADTYRLLYQPTSSIYTCRPKQTFSNHYTTESQNWIRWKINKISMSHISRHHYITCLWIMIKSWTLAYLIFFSLPPMVSMYA